MVSAEGGSFEKSICQADMTLYKSKQMGKNHFVIQKTPKCSDFLGGQNRSCFPYGAQGRTERTTRKYKERREYHKRCSRLSLYRNMNTDAVCDFTLLKNKSIVQCKETEQERCANGNDGALYDWLSPKACTPICCAYQFQQDMRWKFQSLIICRISGEALILHNPKRIADRVPLYIR